MDPFTQVALGAVVGHTVGHARLGPRAALAGALAGALPDIDVLFSINGDFFDQLVLHRGITHSVFFVPVMGPALGYLAWRWERRRGDAPPRSADRGARLTTWMLVTSLALLSHPLLDFLTPYGTQLLLPFSSERFAVNAMPIIDPLYTLMLVLGLLLALRWWRRRATAVAAATLAVSCAYLAYGGHLNAAAEQEARRQLAAQGMPGAQVAAFPTILQLHYRRVVARTPEQDLVGFVSMWRPCDIAWTRASREHGQWPIRDFLATREGQIFDWFTMGWGRYRVEPASDGLRVVATDLRYGFTANPDLSIFNASAAVDLAARVVGPARAGRDAADASRERLALLFREAYAPACRLTGSRHLSPISRR
jgi:inner membrane protein